MVTTYPVHISHLHHMIFCFLFIFWSSIVRDKSPTSAFSQDGLVISCIIRGVLYSIGRNPYSLPLHFSSHYSHSFMRDTVLRSKRQTNPVAVFEIPAPPYHTLLSCESGSVRLTASSPRGPATCPACEDSWSRTHCESELCVVCTRKGVQFRWYRSTLFSPG